MKDVFEIRDNMKAAVEMGDVREHDILHACALMVKDYCQSTVCNDCCFSRPSDNTCALGRDNHHRFGDDGLIVQAANYGWADHCQDEDWPEDEEQ